jgi:nucleoside-diphosphate-sugar epimerase
MTTAAVFGSTGFVGAEILASLLSSPSYTAVHTISRRQPAGQGNTKLHSELESETSKWPAQLSAIKPTPDIVYSGVGTTRAAAGGIANQWKIDHDLNVELAQAAKKAGVKTFVFISSAGTRSALSSRVPYSQMKNGVEDAIKECDFEQAIILKPGLIMGPRKPEEEKFGGPLMNTLVNGLGRINQSWKDGMGQDRKEIGRAAVEAAKVAAEGKAPSKYWVLDGKDIIKFGRIEGLGEEAKAETVKP